MELESLLSEEYKQSPYGAAHVDPADAYRGVPFLKKPVWKNEIAAYFFLGGVSAGSALLGSLAELVGGAAHRKFAHTAHYVSFVTFLPCPLLLIDDLGVPSKFYHMLRLFKPSSPMNLGSWAFAIHGAGATVTVLRMLAADGKLPLIGVPIVVLPEGLLATLGIPSSLLLAGYTGVLLGTTSIPVWYMSRLLGALFTASSISTGAAAVVVAGAISDKGDHKSLQSTGIIRLVGDGATLAAYLAYARTTGTASAPLWMGERRILNATSIALLILSIIAGAVTISRRTHRAGRVLSAVSSLASGALMRWAIVRAGRVSAEDRQGALHAMRATEKRPGWTPSA